MPNSRTLSIPIDLRNRLDADTDRAAQAGDRRCAEIRRQLAAYTGNDAVQRARDLGAEACTMRYAAARELMQLVVQVQTNATRTKAGQITGKSRRYRVNSRGSRVEKAGVSVAQRRSLVWQRLRSSGTYRNGVQGIAGLYPAR
jgi:hypothetical protein